MVVVVMNMIISFLGVKVVKVSYQIVKSFKLVLIGNQVWCLIIFDDVNDVG